MIRRFYFGVGASLCCAWFLLNVPVISAQAAAAQGQTGSAQGNKAADVIAHPAAKVQPANVAGNWQTSWTARLGTEKGALRLHQEGAKLTGTFEDFRGVSKLAGSVDGNKLTFDVQFGGRYPFTTRFTGTADGDKIEGKSEAINVDGGGAFLGHGGEVVNPDHPWTGTRVSSDPGQPAAANTTAKPAASN